MNDLCCVVACTLVHCTPLHQALPRGLVFWLVFIRVSGSNPAIKDWRNLGYNYYKTSEQHSLHRTMFKTSCFGTINVAEVPYSRWQVRMPVGYIDRQSQGLLWLSSVAPEKVETLHTISPWELILQGGSNMTGTDLCVNKPHCAAAVRPWESEATTSTLPPARVRTCSILSGSC